MKEILNEARQIEKDIIGWRHDLHQIPELDLDLPQTQSYVCSILDDLGIPYQTFRGNSSICAVLTGGKPGRTVALRSDMDALHIQEETGLPFASTNGNMHACGHDTHMAMMLGAARILSERREELPGTVKFLFQVGEEGSGGAADMIKNGVMENPRVDAVFGQHVGELTSELGPGHFGFFPGRFMASRDNFVITIHGKGCHGSHPAQGVDPIVISAYVITALQTLVSREAEVDNPGVLTIGAIHGGEVYNIIPDEVVLQGAIRCLSEEYRKYFEQRIREVCEGVCKTMRGSCTIEYFYGYPVTENDPEMTHFAMETAQMVLGEEEAQQLTHPLTGSEDMSFFLQECPGSYWIISAPPKEGEAYPNHSPHFMIDESMLHKGAAVMASVAWRWLQEHS